MLESETERAVVYSRVSKERPTGQIWLTTYFVNKILLYHRHARLFTVCLWLISHSNEQRCVLATETFWLTKLKTFTVWPFTEKVCHGLTI